MPRKKSQRKRSRKVRKRSRKKSKKRSTRKRCKSLRKKQCVNRRKSRGCQWKKGKGCRIIKCKKGSRRNLSLPYNCEEQKIVEKVAEQVMKVLFDPALPGEQCRDLLKKQCDPAYNCSWSKLRKKTKCRGKPYTVTGGKSGSMRNYNSNKPGDFGPPPLENLIMDPLP